MRPGEDRETFAGPTSSAEVSGGFSDWKLEVYTQYIEIH